MRAFEKEHFREVRKEDRRARSKVLPAAVQTIGPVHFLAHNVPRLEFYVQAQQKS